MFLPRYHDLRIILLYIYVILIMSNIHTHFKDFLKSVPSLLGSSNNYRKWALTVAQVTTPGCEGYYCGWKIGQQNLAKTLYNVENHELPVMPSLKNLKLETTLTGLGPRAKICFESLAVWPFGSRKMNGIYRTPSLCLILLLQLWRLRTMRQGIVEPAAICIICFFLLESGQGVG